MAIDIRNMREVPPPPMSPRTPVREREREEIETSAEYVVSGSVVEFISGAATVALAIVGLCVTGPLQIWLLAIAAIAAGSGLLCQGVAIAARYNRLLHETGSTEQNVAELGGGMTFEFLGGAGAIVLGILALCQIMPITQCAVAAIVLGGALLLGSGIAVPLNTLYVNRMGWDRDMFAVARDAVKTAAIVQALVGIAAVVLGILALLGTSALDLSLIAMLCIGGSTLFTGAALSSRMLALLNR